MKFRLIVSALAACATVPALVFGVGLSAAHAETTDTAQTIIDSALSNLGTEVIDSDLNAELQEEIVTAIEEGIIDPAIVDAADSETALDQSDLADLINENLSEENDTWTEAEPAWAAAFDVIRADFALCRTDGKSTSTCARTLGFQLQIAHAEAELAQIDAAITAVASLPEEEQAAALTELEAQRVELQAHLDRATTKLDSAVNAGAPGATPAIQAKLNAVLEGVRGRAIAPVSPGQAQPNLPSENPGSTNSVNPETPEQVGGSVRVEQAPGNSGSTGRPATPGSQGQGNSNRNNR